MTTHWAGLGGGQPSTQRGALTRTCPLCGAKPGEKCRDQRSQWKFVNPHRERKKESQG